MPHIGITELLLILAIVLVVFGATRLPRLGRGLGEGIRNFRDGLRGGDGEEPSDRPSRRGSGDDAA